MHLLSLGSVVDFLSLDSRSHLYFTFPHPQTFDTWASPVNEWYAHLYCYGACRGGGVAPVEAICYWLHALAVACTLCHCGRLTLPGHDICLSVPAKLYKRLCRHLLRMRLCVRHITPLPISHFFILSTAGVHSGVQAKLLSTWSPAA